MKLKSIAWQYFARDEKNSTASCMYCGQTFKVPTSGTTTNLINHLRDKHRSSLVESHPHMIPALPDAEKHGTQYPESFCAEPASSERSSPIFQEELIKPEPLEDNTGMPDKYSPHLDNRHESVVKSDPQPQEQDAERPKSVENPQIIPPPVKRVKLMKDVPPSPSSLSVKMEEYRVLGNFVSSELRSAAEVDPGLAMKASIAIQEALLNLKKDLILGNKV